MTWDARDIHSPVTPHPPLGSVPTSPAAGIPDVIPLQSGLPLFQNADDDDPFQSLSPVEQDMARRSGMFPRQEWDLWRSRLLRNEDGLF